MKKLMFSIFLFIVSNAGADDVWFVNENGFGAKALSMGNNFVAISNDLSALYWNPAGLSFSLVREIHLSLDASSLKGKFDFLNKESQYSMNRLKLSNAGIMYSFPATQGGFTLAMAYSKPIVFDDVSRLTGRFVNDGNTYNVDNKYKTSGSLNYISGGFGLQVAPKTGIGATVSLVYGNEDIESSAKLKKSVNQYYEDTTNFYGYDMKYIGYDIRLGALYNNDLFSAGMRFAFPQVLKLTESAHEKMVVESSYSPPKSSTYTDKYDGKMYSSYSGAAGISLTLPFMTFSAEGRATLPYTFAFPSEDIPVNSQASNYKIGAGVGVEFPISGLPMVLRAGYSYDEVDYHKYLIKYDGEDDFIWDDDNYYTDRNKHLITAGAGFFSSYLSCNISYSFSTYKIKHQINLVQGEDTMEDLSQDYRSHKLMISLALRY